MRLIITADWHLRSTKPRCRVEENWIGTMENAINQVLDTARKKNCSVAIVGDIFNSNSDTSFQCINLIQQFALRLKKDKLRLYVLAGNHDLPYHSTSNLDKSAIGILLNSDNIYPLSLLGENISASNFDEEVENKEIVFRHILCFPDFKSLPPNVDAITAKELLEETPEAKWIFLGDYHRNFVYEKNGRRVVNPGCLIRQASDMKDYQCGVYFVDTDENITEFIPIIDKEDFVDDSYILQQKEREGRIEEFVSELSKVKEVSLDFIENVKKAILENDLDDGTKNMIEELLEV